MGVAPGQAWLELEAHLDPKPGEPTMPGPSIRYDAVFDLESGCVTETYRPPHREGLGLEPAAGDPSGLLVGESSYGQFEGAALDPTKPAFARVLGPYLGFLDRFPIHYFDAVPRRERAFEGLAYSENKQFIAVQLGSSVHLSRDGGKSFAKLEGPTGSSPSFVGDRFLLLWSDEPDVGRGSDGSKLVLIVYSLRDMSPPRVIPLPAGYLPGGSDDTSVFLTHDGSRLTERCVSSVDVATGSLEQSYCMNGPPRRPDTVFLMQRSANGKFGVYSSGDFAETRIHLVDAMTGKSLRVLAQHVFGMAWSELRDDGSYAWQASSDGHVRVVGARGDRDLGQIGDFLGWDLAGRVLAFRRPPLVRAHKTGSMMPPARGALGDYRCSLLRVVDPYAARSARSIHAAASQR